MPIIGEIKEFAGKSAPPGWLRCDGSSYRVKDKFHLFKTVGYTYGGEGEVFHVPDLRDSVIMKIIKE